jgi:hypothetical protein
MILQRYLTLFWRWLWLMLLMTLLARRAAVSGQSTRYAGVLELEFVIMVIAVSCVKLLSAHIPHIIRAGA